MDNFNDGLGQKFYGPVDAETSLPVRNHSRYRRMFWIGFYTTFLSIITLTTFRFWGRTQFRHQLWSDTMIGDEPLTYTGSGRELFIGFVMAIFTFLLPFYVLVFAVRSLFERGMVSIILTVLSVFLLFMFGVAIYLARRYHLSRTRLRSIHFAQTGSAFGYGWVNFWYGVLTIITLGWYAPAARIALSRRLWSAAYFGDQKIRFEDTPEAKKEPVYLSFALSWISFVIVSVFLLQKPSANYVLLIQATTIESQLSPFVSQDFWGSSLYFASLGLLGFLSFAIFSWHRAVMTRRIFKSIRVGSISLTNRITTLDMAWISLTNGLLIFISAGVAFMPAQMRMWRCIANRTSLHGTIDFATIGQSRIGAPRQGEGLADGFDLVMRFFK